VSEPNETVLALTADIVAAHVANNSVSVGDLPDLIRNVHDALEGLGEPAAAEAPAKREPRVTVRSSVKPDHIVCLIDGSKHKMLKRHLKTAHGLTPAEYRSEFGLRADYPMVAPAYSETRRDLAKKIGLGTKGRRKVAAAAAGVAAAAVAAATQIKPPRKPRKKSPAA
jgi:predicted transcriptional regulator